jgi:hypothetical protein
MTQAIRINDATYSRPFPDSHMRQMVAVEYDDGDRFCTYAISDDVLNAWAEVDVFGRQLTAADV